MWYLLQLGIVIYLCILFKSEIAPDHSMGHIFLFSTTGGLCRHLADFPRHRLGSH